MENLFGAERSLCAKKSAVNYVAYLFDAFPQGDRSEARGRGGLGIGLTVAKGLMELHGGTIAAASAGVGKGAEIILRLPCAAAPSSLKPEPRSSSPYARPLRVAIIEDSLDTAESLGLLLDLLGYTVSMAHSGHAGSRW